MKFKHYRMNLKQLNALGKMFVTDPDGATSFLAFRRKCAPMPYQFVKADECHFWITWKQVEWCIAPSGLLY